MLNKLIFFFVVLIALIIGFHQALGNGSLLKYLDEHPNPDYVPKAEFLIGEGYYLFQNPQDAVTYFLRVTDRYPKSPYADDAYFAYLRCLDDSPGASRATLIEEYQKYLERFPEGKNVSIVQGRLDAYHNGAR